MIATKNWVMRIISSIERDLIDIHRESVNARSDIISLQLEVERLKKRKRK